jgi:CheY-like chemotaxis protein
VEVNRKVATAILSKAGYRVVSANNGLEALAAVTDESFGLILMDIAMPVMDGHEATRRIRTLPGKLGRIPIVAMTAGTFDDDRQVCLALGMNDFLAKPVVKADLLVAVRRWLSSHDDGTSTSPNGVVPLDRT